MHPRTGKRVIESSSVVSCVGGNSRAASAAAVTVAVCHPRGSRKYGLLLFRSLDLSIPTDFISGGGLGLEHRVTGTTTPFSYPQSL